LNELNELEAQELEEPAPAYEAPKSSIALPSAPTNTVKVIKYLCNYIVIRS
jgi:hypothetical protein